MPFTGSKRESDSIEFSGAIVRAPGANFADGITTSTEGAPDFTLACAQHAAYCAALRQCGLRLTELPVDPRYPDGVFVEDVAVVTERVAILTRPGAANRAGEAALMRSTLHEFFEQVAVIEPPGTLDGGDVCDAGGHFFIGVSSRTNAEGAGQLARILERHGYTASLVPIHGSPTLLHLKSGIASLGRRTLLVTDELRSTDSWSGFNLMRVPAEEEYAANCIVVNGACFVAEGYPRTHDLLQRLGFDLTPLAMSEFRKMDGGLSCLSLRF